MLRARIQKESATRGFWTIRAISIIGAIATAIAIMLETGVTPRGWWHKGTAPQPAQVAKAQVQPLTLPTPVGVAPPTPKGNDSSVSRVPLQLILVHVQPGRSKSEGWAQIGVVRESPQTYVAGAILENGARLAEIHSDYVLLQREGRTARLYLESGTSGRATDNAMLVVGQIKETPPPAKITSREILTDYIRPSPVYDGESVVGYQVYPGAKSTPFYQMGLKPGDLIVEIDGMPMNEQSSAWNILHQLADGDVLSALVKRSTGVERVSLDGMFLVRAEEARSRGPAQAMLEPPVH